MVPPPFILFSQQSFTLSFLASSSTEGQVSIAVGKVSVQARLRSNFVSLEIDSSETAWIWKWPRDETLHAGIWEGVEASIALAMEPTASEENLYLRKTLNVCSQCARTVAWLDFSLTLRFKNKMVQSLDAKLFFRSRLRKLWK